MTARTSSSKAGPAPEGRLELGQGAWLGYFPTWLAPQAASELMVDLLAKLDWEEREIRLFGRRMLQPRLIAWGGSLPYRYSGQTLPVRPLPSIVGNLLEEVSRHAETTFNHVLFNRYRNERDSMGMHADDEPELGPDPILASLSLGETRRFVLEPKERSRRRSERRCLQLTHGSLLVMGGTTQRHYRHGVPKEHHARGERVNLTFRRLNPAAAD